MIWDSEYDVFIADEDEDIDTFIDELIKQRKKRKTRSIVGEYDDCSILVGPKDTKESILKRYHMEKKQEQNNPFKKRTFNNLRRNASGYSDPTAYQAIKNVDREIERRRRSMEK